MTYSYVNNFIIYRIIVSNRTCDGVYDCCFQVFVDHPSYHRPGNPYGNIYGPFGDNQVLF